MLCFIPRSPIPFDQHAAAALKPYTGVAARLLYARGMKTAKDADAFLHPSLDQLHDPFLLDGMEKAVEILQNAKVERLPVVVYGDYDVDGICAASLLTLALRRYGITADSYTPLREDGYGLHSEAVEALSARYAVLLTVDLGITNHEEVLFAKEKGMTVIVTDHHEPGLSPSPADAVMDPLLGSYPFRRLCGTGVAFKLAQALYLKLTLRQEKSVMDGIAFSMGRLASTLPDRVDAAFCLGENTFRGLTSLQAEVKALVPTGAGTEEPLSLADGEKEALSLLDALEALAGKTPSDGECLQGMSAEEAKAAFGESRRGDLLVCRTRESARRAVALSGGEFSFGLPADPLGFPAVALCPSMAATGHWKRVWLMDGPVCGGEATFWRERLPDCQIVPLERSASLQALAGSLLLDDEGYRCVYRLLRKIPCHSLDALAQGAEITRAQARAALSVLQDMGLLAWVDTPFSCALLPPVKCSLEENRLLRALRALCCVKSSIAHPDKRDGLPKEVR